MVTLSLSLLFSTATRKRRRNNSNGPIPFNVLFCVVMGHHRLPVHPKHQRPPRRCGFDLSPERGEAAPHCLQGWHCKVVGACKAEGLCLRYIYVCHFFYFYFFYLYLFFLEGYFSSFCLLLDWLASFLGGYALVRIVVLMGGLFFFLFFSFIFFLFVQGPIEFAAAETAKDSNEAIQVY